MKLELSGDVRIVYKNGQPDYIRDDGGVLMSFPRVRKWTDQEDRYRRELGEVFVLADIILKRLTE